jgi:hypothetical protein
MGVAAKLATKPSASQNSAGRMRLVNATLALVFAILSVLLAAVGLYGVLSYLSTSGLRSSGSAWRSARGEISSCS